MMLDTSRAIRRNLIAAAAVIIACGGAATAWSMYAPLESAVVVSGTVIVEGNVKKVQHATGGIVGEIRVHEGSRVEAGDVLVRLDGTATRANLAILVNDLTAQRARLARLQALRDGLKEPVFPRDLTEAAKRDPVILGVLDGETRLARFKQSTRDEQKQQLAERVKQTRQEVRGLEEQQKSLAGQLEIARKELEDLSSLLERGNVLRPRVTALEREVLRTGGLLGETVAKIAQAQAKIAETELHSVQLDHDFITEVIKDLRETETKTRELEERKAAAEDQLQRLDIRAPAAGQVHQLAVHTVGGVISPSETLMLIVPSGGKLIVDVRISPSDIDQVTAGQPARVRFPAFNRRVTDEVQGTVFRVAADLTYEQQNNLAYYTAGIRVTEEEMAALDGLRLVPGMPAEVFIKTGERTLANYLARPLLDQMARAFRER